jgi:pyruvate/2-oxoglutarate dehydrogenase complex dihydrolipoamide acyltransferase (E2) component
VTAVRVPKLGMSMTEGEIVEWQVADGDRVEVGQTLYTLATDKVDSDIESPESGTIRVIGEVGMAYEVGTIIAEIS